MTDYLPLGRSFQPLERIHVAEWNPRIIQEADFKALCESIRQRPAFMMRRPVLVADGPIHQAGGIIHGGNHRRLALGELHKQGWAPPPDLQAAGWVRGTCPVDVDDIPEDEAKALAIIDNNTWANWQEEQLAEMVYKLGEAGTDLSLLGFNEKELKGLLDSVGALGDGHGNGEIAEDDVPPPPAVAISKPGELWLLGGYTVCPDCGAHNELGVGATE